MKSIEVTPSGPTRKTTRIFIPDGVVVVVNDIRTFSHTDRRTALDVGDKQFILAEEPEDVARKIEESIRMERFERESEA